MQTQLYHEVCVHHDVGVRYDVPPARLGAWYVAHPVQLEVRYPTRCTHCLQAVSTKLRDTVQVGQIMRPAVLCPEIGRCHLYSSVQNGIYALGKTSMRSTPSLGSFPNVASETVPMFI